MFHFFFGILCDCLLRFFMLGFMTRKIRRVKEWERNFIFIWCDILRLWCRLPLWGFVKKILALFSLWRFCWMTRPSLFIFHAEILRQSRDLCTSANLKSLWRLCRRLVSFGSFHHMPAIHQFMICLSDYVQFICVRRSPKIEFSHTFHCEHC